MKTRAKSRIPEKEINNQVVKVDEKLTIEFEEPTKQSHKRIEVDKLALLMLKAENAMLKQNLKRMTEKSYIHKEKIHEKSKRAVVEIDKLAYLMLKAENSALKYKLKLSRNDSNNKEKTKSRKRSGEEINERILGLNKKYPNVSFTVNDVSNHQKKTNRNEIQ